MNNFKELFRFIRTSLNCILIFAIETINKLKDSEVVVLFGQMECWTTADSLTDMKVRALELQQPSNIFSEIFSVRR